MNTKRVNKTKNLEKTLGGKWKYCGAFSFRWECDDGRSVQLCSASDMNDYCESFHSEYWLYGDGLPDRAERFIYDHASIFAKLAAKK